MAQRRRNRGVGGKKTKKRRSAPKPDSPAKQTALPSSPLRKGLTYGKDVFSESENDTDAGGAAAASVADDGNDDHDEVGDACPQQAAPTTTTTTTTTTGGSVAVAGPSRRRPRLADMSPDEMSPLDRLVHMTVQSIKKNRRPFPSPAVSRVCIEDAQFLQTASPPPTPQLEEELSDEELREGVEEILDLMFPGEVYASVPSPPPTTTTTNTTTMPSSASASASASGSPPVGTFRPPRDWSEVPAPAPRQGGAESTAANLPPSGLFSPTGKTLQAYRESHPSGAATAVGPHRDEPSTVSESAAPVPPMGTFSPPAQALRAHHPRQSQKTSSEATSSHHHSDEGSRAAPSVPAPAPASSFNPPIPHVPAQKEDTSKLDLLAAVALGQLDPNPLAALDLLFPGHPAPGPAPGSEFAISSSTAAAQPTIDKGNKRNTVTSPSAAMAPPPPAAGRTPTRRRGPQRRAALKSQELSRKMTTKREIRNLLKNNAENANNPVVTTTDTTNNSSSTAVRGSSSPPTDDNYNTIDPATSQPYAEVNMGDHVFRDIPHKDSFFPRPKARELKKAVAAAAAAGDPHDPEFVKRHTERYQKRLEMNTFQWPDSNVRGAEDTEAHQDRMIKNKMAQMIRDFEEKEALEEEAEKRQAERLAEEKKKDNDNSKGKGKQRASSVDLEDVDDDDVVAVEEANPSDDEAATVADDDVTVTDEDRARAGEEERNKLLRDAIAVWQNNEDIRNHYNKLDREQSQRDLRHVNSMFNSRLFRAAERGDAPTPPPEDQSSTTGISGKDSGNTYSGGPSSSSSGAHAHRVVSPKRAIEAIFANVSSAAAQQPLPTPETSFNGEGSSSQSFDFRMRIPCPQTNETGGDNMGLDGACDVPRNVEHEQQPRHIHSASGHHGIYEEVDFERDNPVTTQPEPRSRGAASAGSNKNTRGGRHHQPSDAPVNKTSKLGDDPFYYDPRFDPTEVYPGILHGRYRHRRRLVPGGAEARERVEAAKKREAEEEERRRKQLEDEIRNDPIEALLREFMGDEYVGPQGYASGSGSGSGTADGPSLFSSLADDDHAPHDDPVEKNGPNGPKSQ